MADARCPSSPSHPAESSRVFESIRIDNFSHHDFPTNSLNPFLDEVSTRSGSDGAPRHCRLPIADCRLPIADYQFSLVHIGNCKLEIANGLTRSHPAPRARCSRWDRSHVLTSGGIVI